MRLLANENIPLASVVAMGKTHQIFWARSLLAVRHTLSFARA